MSQNHLRGDKESPYRKTGVGAKYNNSSDYQQRPLSGGGGPGTASSISSNASASRSFKKRNNAQVWIALKNSGPVNPSSDPNPTTTARHVENGSHVKSTVTGESQKPAAAATPKPADALRQKSSQPVPKAPSSLTASMASDSTSSTTPSKGDAGKGFSLQFGSISPGFMNVPARTSSAPPNLDEQQRNQALRTASKASPPNPAPTAPKQQTPNSDVPTEKPTTQGSRKTPLMGTSPAPPVQTQKPGVLPVPGTSMSMPFTQPNNPLPFGGPNTQIPSHVIRPNSHQMPQMPLPIGNSSQVQQPLYVPRYTQHHIMQNRAKERRLKAILNKLTPQNFYKVFEQVKEVKIDNVITLTGLVSQIFDKALMEPTFCEMYSNFCQHLASELPELSVDNQKITFRRLLLNKCQEEFERGEREEEEVNKDEGETKQTDQEREEKRLKVRRRMLGNIRLIGELYKKRMLTERVMHECIKKLLGNYQNADEENIEALCKLMSTIGEMIDHPKAKEHMDAYFDIMRQLSNDMKLSSRVRFMLRDTIDLRKNRWQQRRKVEGPREARSEIVQDVAGKLVSDDTQLDATRRYRDLCRKFVKIASRAAAFKESSLLLDRGLDSIIKDVEKQLTSMKLENGLFGSGVTDQVASLDQVCAGSCSTLNKITLKRKVKATGGRRKLSWIEKLHKKKSRNLKAQSVELEQQPTTNCPRRKQKNHYNKEDAYEQTCAVNSSRTILLEDLNLTPTETLILNTLLLKHQMSRA